ncbi:iron ABC transporter permease [Palaeococcus pacificus DY20341]|uniref:Iron ABC transporter permease n=1 Tax=Palaeococcus pacificus DY20341 TaxID=1343739 RepID=A0A075LU60_9EURY|nr:iron ABC transporter permease [Palaeococcus pacificus]AIF69502.1 iron ABC transporter permease [Palaeococcus pacificus DY20341]
MAKVSKWSEKLFGTPLFEPLVAFSYLFPLIYLAIFLIVPVVTMLLIAFSYEGTPSLHWFKNILSSSYYVQFPPQGDFVNKQITATGETVYLLRGIDFGVIVNSLLVSGIVTILASLLGTIFAFVMARYDFRGKNFFRIALFVPLLVTPFVNAYVIKRMFIEYGIVNYILHDILHLLPFRIKVDGLVGVAIAQAMAYYPIVYLNAYASFINIDPTLEEQAENLGSKSLHLFRTVTFPLALPGIAAGATLVFIFSLEDLAAPIVFHGDPLAKKLMSFQIYSKFLGEFGERSPEIAALSIIMLALAILAFLGIRKYVSLRQYAMLSKGGRWKPRVSKPKPWQAVLIYALLLPMLLFTIFPQIGVVMLSLAKQWSVTVLPNGLTLNWIKEMIIKPEVRSAIINSLTYAGAAVIMIILLAVTSSYAAGRFKGALSPVLESIVILPMAVPGIVVAMGYFYLFSSLFPNTILDPISINFNPALVLIIAYSIRRLPFAARSVFAGLQQVHVSLEEASMNLGASRWKTISGVLLPLISLNVFGGAMLSFVYSMSETSTSITLGALVTERQPMTAYMADVMMSGVGSVHVVAALGLLLIIVQIIAIVLVNMITKQRYSFIGLT